MCFFGGACGGSSAGRLSSLYGDPIATLADQAYAFSVGIGLGLLSGLAVVILLLVVRRF